MSHRIHRPVQSRDLAPRVIDLIPVRTRAELEAAIDGPLTIESFERDDSSNTIIVGNKRAGRTFSTKPTLLAEVREDSETRGED